jgi:broad specificity phosphatase PhoE
MTPKLLVLVKHGSPVLDPAAPAREWVLSGHGETEALHVAEQLRAYHPLDLVSSPEPKARRTAELIATVLRTRSRVVDDLREIDRRVLPIMEPEWHREMNRPIFSEPDRAVLGSESANTALLRYQAAIHAEIDGCESPHLVVVSHGTVMALLVARHNAVDAFRFWADLQCGSAVTLTLPLLRLVEPFAISGNDGSPGPHEGVIPQ